MTHGLSAETQKAGGDKLAKQSAEEWYQELQKNTIRSVDIRYILWDWQNERVEFIQILEALEWSSETIDGAKMCPMCSWERSMGHHSTCKLAEAIA